MFRMYPSESILNLQKRSSHLINHLTTLGKYFTNDGLNLKVLRSLTNVWKPKMTIISEKKSLSKMSFVTYYKNMR